MKKMNKLTSLLLSLLVAVIGKEPEGNLVAKPRLDVVGHNVAVGQVGNL